MTTSLDGPPNDYWRAFDRSSGQFTDQLSGNSTSTASVWGDGGLSSPTGAQGSGRKSGPPGRGGGLPPGLAAKGGPPGLMKKLPATLATDPDPERERHDQRAAGDKPQDPPPERFGWKARKGAQGA